MGYNLRQFLSFSFIGAIGFVVDAGFLQLLVSFGELNPYIGRVFSYLIAASLTWELNRRYTFPKRADVKFHRQWFFYLGVNGIGGLLNYGTYALLVFNSRFFHHYLYLGVGVGAIISLACNFTLSKYFVFKYAPASRI